MFKIGFNVVANPSSLWVRILRSKYGMKEGIPDNIERRKCLFLWRALSNIWPLLRENLYGSIGDGNEIRCWQDPWVPGVGPLVK